MPENSDAAQLQEQLRRLDDLLRVLERDADPATLARTREVVQAVLALHEAGLRRMLGHLGAAGEAGGRVLEACARDEVVGGLLLLHGLHPSDVETRVRQALDQVRPLLRSHGGSVELLGVDHGTVRLRLAGNCHGCPSSAVTMTQTIEEAILGLAPDVLAIEVDGAVEGPPVSQGRGALVVLP